MKYIKAGNWTIYMVGFVIVATNTNIWVAIGVGLISLSQVIYYASYQSQTPWDWRCGGCGEKEYGGVRVDRTKENFEKERWERANNPTNYV